MGKLVFGGMFYASLGKSWAIAIYGQMKKYLNMQLSNSVQGRLCSDLNLDFFSVPWQRQDVMKDSTDAILMPDSRFRCVKGCSIHAAMGQY